LEQADEKKEEISFKWEKKEVAEERTRKDHCDQTNEPPAKGKSQRKS